MPKTMHSAIKWSDKDPFPLNPVAEDSPWTLIKQSKADTDASKQAAMKRDTTNFVSAKGTQALNNVSNAVIKQSAKRKRSMEEDEMDNTLKKKVRQIKAMPPPKGKTFIGIPWDKDNWSCAYDSMLTILLSVYTESPDVWRTEASPQSDVLVKLEQVFKQSLATPPTMTVIQARNQIRDMLGCENPELAARGKTYTDLYELAERLLSVDEDILTKTNVCRRCDYKSGENCSSQVMWTCTENAWKNNPEKLGTYKGKTTSKWIQALRTQQRETPCPHCNYPMLRHKEYNARPPFISFIIDRHKMRLDYQISFPEVDQMYRLCGVVYISTGELTKHFVCKIVDKSGGVWFHDGALPGSMGENVTYSGDNIINLPYQKLQAIKKDYVMTLAIYTRL